LRSFKYVVGGTEKKGSNLLLYIANKIIKIMEISPVVKSEIESPEKYPSEKADPTLSL
jgi:hypothetical protein